MKKLHLLLVFTLFLGCHSDTDDPISYNGTNCIDDNPYFMPLETPENEDYQFTFRQNSKIVLTQYSESESPDYYENLYKVEIVQGQNIVFEYNYTFEDDPQIADDEYDERIVFEIDASIDDFIISGNDLKKSNALFGFYCYCYPAGAIYITDGCIKGKRISETEWEIDINITAQIEDNLYSKMFSERFVVN